MSSAPRLVLLGDPVAHSRSPAMQNAALAAVGFAAHYEVLHTPAARLAEHVALLRTSAYLGANVTLPHKEAVLPMLDELEASAAQIGAVNTIYKRADGALVGANTDAPGLLADLRAHDCAVQGSTALILGASGAARAALFAMLAGGAATIIVANRSVARAEGLVAAAAPHAVGQSLQAVSLSDPTLPAWLAASTLLINATALGWHGDEDPLPAAPLAATTFVYDMVYRETSLLRRAAAVGAAHCNGLGMLLHQGALAFEHWTGHTAPLAVMRRALGLA